MGMPSNLLPAIEQLQTVAHQADRWPILGSQEKRIARLEEAYVQAMSSHQKRIEPDR
jgi:hypothetical protein